MAFSLDSPQRFDDDFVDVLAELRRESDIGFALKAKNFPKFEGHHASERTPRQIVRDTLSGVRVKVAVEQTATENDWSIDATMKLAERLALEMAHDFDLKTVRSLAYVAKKVLPRIYSGVFINRKRFLEIGNLCRKTPVVLMPTHRTYMDFILVQFLCFHYEIPLPAIASAQDFLNMKFMGEALRRCGAFFIRRSFGNDRLYWAVFTEYLDTQLKHADRTVEFFIEGTRSRTGKSLHPKYGLFSRLLAPYFRNDIFDLQVVPISLSFSKIIEEQLYAYELLGFPKPKESTSGLLKARSILNTDFGDVFVHVAAPISIRDYFSPLEQRASGGFGRPTHALRPTLLFEYSDEEQREIRRLSHRIVRIHGQHMLVRLWPLMCAVLLQLFESSTVIAYDQLQRRTATLLDLTERLSCKISLRLGSLTDEISYFLKLHENLVEVRNENYAKEHQLISLHKFAPTSRTNTSNDQVDVPAVVLERAVPRVMLTNYSNQSMHLFADPAMLCVAIRRDDDRRRIYEEFVFLQSLFHREFVIVPYDEPEAFDVSLRRLIDAEIVTEVIDGRWHKIRILNDPIARERSNLLVSLLEPFIVGYWLVADFLLDAAQSLGDNGLGERALISGAQKFISGRLVSGHVLQYQLLSTDLLKNALHTFYHMGALKKLKRNEGASTEMLPDLLKLEFLRDRLENIGNSYCRPLNIKAKL